MLVVNQSEMLLRSRTSIPPELLQKFIAFMQQELLPNCRFNATIQTSFRNYSDMSVEEFLKVYRGETAVHWTIEFHKGNEWAYISFQHLQHSTDQGEASSNFSAEKSQLFRQSVLRMLDVDLR
jgi:hypothetical protein